MYLLDTNVIGEARKGQKANPGVAAFRAQVVNNEDFLPVQALGEIRRGVELLRHRGDQPQANLIENWLEGLLTEYADRILPFDLDAADIWGRLMSPHDQHPIDKQIAAIALLYDLTVVTRNTEAYISAGARVLNPFEDVSKSSQHPMSLWIKICGNTSLLDAQAAIDAGADALGFIFAPSPRQVTPEQAAAIISDLPDPIEKIGVFVDASLADIVAVTETARLTGVQLHSDSSPELPAQLRAHFGKDFRILQVIHFTEIAKDRLAAAASDLNLNGVLVDSRTAHAVGGTGTSFDWKAARKTLFLPECRLKMIAAGGLTPENVAEAITTLRPWGVDVVSGVERAKRHKDHEKVSAFIRNARAAGGTL